MSDEDRLFPSTHAAMVFAYNFSGQAYALSYLAKMMGKPQGPSKGLGGLDGAAQAGMVRLAAGLVPGSCEMEADGYYPLPESRRRVIEARFIPRTMPCSCKRSCCSGRQANREWTEAIRWLADHMLRTALMGTCSHYRLRIDLVQRYFGERVTLNEAAARVGVHRDTASAHNVAIVQALKVEELLALNDVSARLEAAGLIETERAY